MPITLSAENEALVNDAVARGTFASPAEAINEALKLLRRKLELEQLLIEGLESGPGKIVDSSFWDAKRSMLKAERSAESDS